MSAPTRGEAAHTRSENDAGFGPGRFAILLGVCVVAAFPDVIFGWRTFFYRDFGIFGFPLAFYHRESFWRGEIPLWNPLNNCGLPFLAQWNTLVLYPLSIFYLLFPLSWSLGFFCLIHLFLAGLGMYFLAFGWTQNRLAACVAGLVFAFNGLTLSCLKWPNNIAALAWMPWVLWLAERGWRTGGRDLVLAAAIGALQMLTGGPEIILFTWLFAGLLWLAECLRSSGATALPPLDGNAQKARNEMRPTSHHGADNRRRGRLRLVLRLAGMAALVAGLAAVQMLPFLDLLGHSQRDAAYSDASWSLPRWGWANFLVPLFRCFPSHQGVFAQFGQYWISSYYVGIGTVALAVGALFWRKQLKTLGSTQASGRTKVALLAIILSGSLVLALGSDGYLYDAVRKILPQIQIVRFPIKFVVPAVLAFPLLAAFAVAQLQATGATGENNSLEFAGLGAAALQRRSGVRRPIVVIGVAFVILIAAILVFAKIDPLPTDHWRSTLLSGLARVVFLTLILGAAMAVHRATRPTLGGTDRNDRFACGASAQGAGERAWRRRAPIAELGLLLLIWLDLLTHAPRLSPTVERWVFDPGLAEANLKLMPEPKLGATRAMVSPSADDRLNHLALTNAVNDFLFSRMSLFANANLLDSMPKVDGFFSLYTQEQNRIRALLYAATNTALPNLTRFLGVSHVTAPGQVIEWAALPNPMPLVTTGVAPLFADGPATLRALANPGFDPAAHFYLPLEAQGRVAVTNAAKAKVAVERWSAQEIELRVEADQPAWIVLAQTFYHPWRAYVDGIETRIWRANHAFQALEVPSGRRTVRLSYEDGAFRIGTAASTLSGLVCVGIWLQRKKCKEQTQRV